MQAARLEERKVKVGKVIAQGFTGLLVKFLNEWKMSQEIIKKYLGDDYSHQIFIAANGILDDIRYLQAHATRTVNTNCSFVMIPQPDFLRRCYGDGKIFWQLKSELANQNYWIKDNLDEDLEFLSLSSVLKTIVTNSEILRVIFDTEKQNESCSNDNIHIESIKDFLQFSKYIRKMYPRIYDNNIWNLYDISYSHCSRYCKKEEKFKIELEKLIAEDKDV